MLIDRQSTAARFCRKCQKLTKFRQNKATRGGWFLGGVFGRFFTAILMHFFKNMSVSTTASTQASTTTSATAGITATIRASATANTIQVQ